MPYTYEYPRPMVTVDAVVFKKNGADIMALFIKRRNAPYKDMWALPGGFVDMDETLDCAVSRELEEETGLTGIKLVQMYTFGNPGRDPRGRNISIVYYGFANENAQVNAGDDAIDAKWFSINNLPTLGFDHHEVIEKALNIISS